MGDGDISSLMVEDQLDVLNSVYNPNGIHFELYADPILFWSADSTITWASLYISNTTQIDTIKLDFSPSGYVYI